MSMLSAAQVAELLGLSARSVYDIPESRLPRYRVGAQGGAIRYELADVEAYKASCRCTGLLGQS